MKIVAKVLFVIFLTIITQVGGVVYLISLGAKRLIPNWPYKRLWFPVLYLAVWFLLPTVAASYGRVPLPYRATSGQPLQAQHFFTVLANRHYVRPELRDETIRIANVLAQANPDLVLTYLDANFPLWNGFPLLPHRSHNDGRKLDLAFVYQKGAALTTEVPAFLGYGRCAAPQADEKDQPTVCAQQGFWQYSFLPILATPFTNDDYVLAEAPTARMVREFAKSTKIKKLFLEPHLKTRWQLGGYGKIRYHGCAAVRHDDHLHVQL